MSDPVPALSPTQDTPAPRAGHVLAEILSASWFVPLIVAFYVIAGLTLVLSDYTLNDEGLLTYYWASWARQAFIPVFFFQRIRPVLAALYLPASAGGVHVTMVAHVVTAAFGIPMIAAVARALGHRSPNLPALVMALSPLYFYGGAAGLSNTDGVVGIALVLYVLCVRHRPLLAGVIAGALPWVRNELALFTAVLALHGLLVRRDRALVVGLGSFPLLYAVAGAIYHHDPLWLFHFQPKAPADPTYTVWVGQLIGLQYFLEPLLAVTPIVPVIMAIRLVSLQPIERTLILYSATAAVVLNVLPIFHIGNFGTMPRLSMMLLPVLALLVGRAADSWWDDERPALPTLALMMALTVWLATRQQSATAAGFLLVVNLMLIAAIGFRAGTAAVGLAVAVVGAGPLLPIRSEVSRGGTAPYVDPMVDWLRAHRDLLLGPVLTNSQLLSAFAERRLAGTDVWFVIPLEMSRDLSLLSNPANGQRERIRRLCETDLYGRRTVWGPITPDDVPPGALMALSVDARLPMLLPEEAWRGRLEVIEATPQFQIARVLPAAAGVPRS